MHQLKLVIDVPDIEIANARTLSGSPLHMLTPLMGAGEHSFEILPVPGDFLQLVIPTGSGSVTHWVADSYWHASLGDGTTPSVTLHIRPSGAWNDDLRGLLANLEEIKRTKK